jgi:hypothetical protein
MISQPGGEKGRVGPSAARITTQGPLQRHWNSLIGNFVLKPKKYPQLYSYLSALDNY